MDKKKKEALLSLLAARFFAYNLLKRAFLEEPSKDFLELLKNDQLLDFFPGREKKEVKTGTELTAQFLEKSPADMNMCRDVVADYTLVFVALGKIGGNT